MNRTDRKRRGNALRARLRRLCAGVTAVLVVGGIGAALAAPAQAATVYEIEGSWQAPVPTQVKSGDVLSSAWRFNINDDSPAPTNDPVDNVTVTFVAQNARFTALPSACLTTGVTPASSISADGKTLTCNVGTRNQGTAELLLTGIEVDGATGQSVTIGGSIGGVQASLPPIAISNPFAMDMKFDEGAPVSTISSNTQNLSFAWSLRHAPGAIAGPSTVSYDLQFSSTDGNTVTPQVAGCTPQSLVQPAHPFSGAGHPAAETAPFPVACTLVTIGTNRMRLTLTGIDYSKTAVPDTDSAGISLPTEWDVVAAGLLNVRFTYNAPTVTSFTASAPTYTSAAGNLSTDSTANNSNSVASTRGVWTGGWRLNELSPPVEGTQWTDTFRTMAGQPALSRSGVRTPDVGATASTGVCTVVDSKYVDVVDAAMGTVSNGVVTPYVGITYWYYTGTGTNNNLNPASTNYNPNTFTCDGTSGWSTARPANMSTVRAVKAFISPAAGLAIAEAVPTLYVRTTIKPTVAVGQDIWTWTSYTFNGGTTWVNPHRETTASSVPAAGTLTPGARYPFAAAGRDVLRIIAATPKVSKAVDQKETAPGATVTYTLSYRAQAPVNSTIATMTLQDVLPAGMEYVAGSAAPSAPTVSGQTLTWSLTNVPTNIDQVITFQARIPATGVPGATYTNTVNATINGVTATATASTLIRDGGSTMLTKTAAADKVPHDHGVASDSWTVRISSSDTRPQAFTDTIDVLPYNGDGRGTSFTGSYQLSGPVQAVAGATVYYTTASPASLNADPADATNGSAGSVTGNTVGWSTTFVPNATGVRVIGPALAPSTAQEFVVGVTTAGATFEDTYVNLAEARSDRTELVMRTSSRFEIGAVNSVALKKYVQDADGVWHDANDIDDYPSFHTGSTLHYRLLVTNTGDETLYDLVISDDRVDLAALDPLPAGLTAGAILPELLPGAANAVTIEYDVPLTSRPEGGYLVNTACVAPQDTTPPAPGDPAPVEESCDPAGVLVLPSSLAWTKTAAGTSERLSGSEWELTPVDANDAPTGAAVAVVDCVAASAADCTGADVDPGAGMLKVDPLIDGRYRLVETRAPAGFQLDSTPRFVTVLGATTLNQPIENTESEGPTLPLTGGWGGFVFWLIGGALGGLMFLALFWQWRRSSRRESARDV